MKKKKKPGPQPWGLGSPFTLRLTLEQEKQISDDCKRLRIGRGEAVRRRLGC